eukprot:CAMPEP_0194542020 /NCGR_PEP_ID=MMETSP0253-20130528/83285_1 /TAXON_ID=2966 /ORGANISM="Noctiluca scintillans" /LENGTH=42 /DNA_ID= /DNA_START= /DNA_END= /DNA_ORIENTATION=
MASEGSTSAARAEAASAERTKFAEDDGAPCALLHRSLSQPGL